jgi:hypothetical protein
MIRRTFWLVVGAIGGIMGYRRVVAVGRGVSGRLDADGTKAVRARKVRRGLLRGTISFSRGTIRFSRDARDFTRDVREGMDLYIARHPGPGGNTLGPSEETKVKEDR